jgi:hypothetical protein
LFPKGKQRIDRNRHRPAAVERKERKGRSMTAQRLVATAVANQEGRGACAA